MIPFATNLIVPGATTAAPPTFTLDFTGGTLPGGVTASGSANGKRVTVAGLLAASTAPRFDYSPVTVGTLRGLLVEPAATNLCLQSEAFDAASWSKTDTTITANAGTAPDGTSSADLATEGSAGTAVTKQTIAIVTGASYWFTIYVKSVSATWLRFQMSNGAGTQSYVAWIDVSARVVGTVATVGTPTQLGAAIEDAGGGWRRVTLGTALPAGTSMVCQFQSAAGNGSNARVATASYQLWGAQIEQSAAATSYLGPVAGTAVTRSADAVALTVPAGTGKLTFGFDDATSQQVTVAPGAYAVPTTLNRARIRTITGFA